MNALPQTLEEQFDYAVRIIQRCFQQKASQTEEELFRLRHTLKERDLLLQELATKVSTLEQQFEGAQVTIQRLTEENGRMIHSLKRAILDSLDGDSNSLSSHTLANSQIPSSFYNSISSPVRFSPSAAVHSATNLYQQQQQQQQQQQPTQPQTPSHLQYNVSSLNGQPKKIQISPPPKFFPSTQTHTKYVSPSIDTLDIIAQIDRGIELSSFSNPVSTISTHSPINIKTTPTPTSYQSSQLSFASKYKPFDPSELLGLGESTSSSSIGKLNLGSNNNASNSSEVSSLSGIKSTLNNINKDGPSLLRSIGASSLSSLSNNNDNSSSSLTSNTTANSESSNTSASIPPPPLKMPLKPPTQKSIIQPKPDSETNSNENPTPSEPSSSIPPPPLKMPLKPPTLKSIIQPKLDSETNSNENPSLNSSASESPNAPQPPKPPTMPLPPPAPKLKLKLPPPKSIDG